MKKFDLLKLPLIFFIVLFSGRSFGSETEKMWLKNGMILDVSLQSFQEDKATFYCDLFENKGVQIPFSEIKSWRFAHGVAETPYFPIKLYLCDGGTLSGTPQKSETGWLSIKSFWGQRFKIKMDQIEKIDVLPLPEDRLVIGALGRENWVPSRNWEEKDTVIDGTQFVAGRLHLASLSDFDHSLTFDSAPQTKTTFTIFFKEMYLKHYLFELKGPAVEKHEQDLLVIDYGQKTLEIKGRMGTEKHSIKMELPPYSTRHKWEIYKDTEKGALFVFLNEALLYQWQLPHPEASPRPEPDPERSELIESFHLKGMSSPHPAILDGFQVSRWDGEHLPYQKQAPTKPYVMLNESDRDALVEGSLEFLSNGRIRYLTRDGVEEKIRPYTSIKGIVLNSKPVSRSEQSIQVRCDETGDLLVLSDLTFDGKVYKGKSSFSPKDLVIPLHYIDAMVFPERVGRQYRSPRIDRSSQLVLKNGCRLPMSTWLFVDDILKVDTHWALDSILIPLSHIHELQLGAGEKRYYAHSSGLEARDGSVLRGYAPEASEDQFVFKTPWGQKISVPLTQIFRYEMLADTAEILRGLHLQNAHFDLEKYNYKKRESYELRYDVGETLPTHFSESLMTTFDTVPLVFVVKAELITEASFPDSLEIRFKNSDTDYEWLSYLYRVIHNRTRFRLHSQAAKYIEEDPPTRSGRQWKIAVLVDLTESMTRLYINDVLEAETPMAPKYQGTPLTLTFKTSRDASIKNLEVIALDAFRNLNDDAATGNEYDPSMFIHQNNLPLLKNVSTTGWVQVEGPANSGKLWLKPSGQTSTHIIGKVRFSDEDLLIPLDWIRRIEIDPQSATDYIPKRRAWELLE